MTFQAVAALSNNQRLCICEITDAEAEAARADDPCFDGFGLYLVAVDATDPKRPATVLAKFLAEDAALQVAQLFRTQQLLERDDSVVTQSRLIRPITRPAICTSDASRS